MYIYLCKYFILSDTIILFIKANTYNGYFCIYLDKIKNKQK